MRLGYMECRPNCLKVYGLTLAAAWLVIDQVAKYWILQHTVVSHQPIMITPFLNIVLSWNVGISFGLLRDYDLSPWILTIFSGCVTLGLIIWMFRSRDFVVMTCLALIIGGASSNALDRLNHGAVVDFLDIHAGSWHWPAFNLADFGIACGAGLFVFSNLTGARSPSSQAPQPSSLDKQKVDV